MSSIATMNPQAPRATGEIARQTGLTPPDRALDVAREAAAGATVRGIFLPTMARGERAVGRHAGRRTRPAAQCRTRCRAQRRTRRRLAVACPVRRERTFYGQYSGRRPQRQHDDCARAAVRRPRGVVIRWIHEGSQRPGVDDHRLPDGRVPDDLRDHRNPDGCANVPTGAPSATRGRRLYRIRRNNPPVRMV